MPSALSILGSSPSLPLSLPLSIFLPLLSPIPIGTKPNGANVSIRESSKINSASFCFCEWAIFTFLDSELVLRFCFFSPALHSGRSWWSLRRRRAACLKIPEFTEGVRGICFFFFFSFGYRSRFMGVGAKYCHLCAVYLGVWRD